MKPAFCSVSPSQIKQQLAPMQDWLWDAKREHTTELLERYSAELSDAEQELRMAQAALDELEQHHSDHLASLKSLQAFISPTRRLSSEILSLIFLNLVELDASPLTVAAVCKKWRSVALEMKSLWTKLVIPAAIGPQFRLGPTELENFQAFFKRSGKTPLELTVFIPKRTTARYSHATMDTVFQQLGENNFSRWKTASFEREGKSNKSLIPYRYFKNASLPLLHAVSTNFASFDAARLLRDASLPNLRSLDMKLADFFIISPRLSFWTRLTSLRLSMEADYYQKEWEGIGYDVVKARKARDLYLILRQTTHLQRLSLQDLTIENYEEDEDWVDDESDTEGRCENCGCYHHDLPRQRSLLSFPFLQTMQLTDCHVNHPLYLPILEAMTLKRTHIWFDEFNKTLSLPELTTIVFSPRQDMLRRLKAPKLRRLVLTGRPSKHGPTWKDIQLPCSPPLELQFLNCTISESDMVSFLSQLPDLKVLEVTNLLVSKGLLQALSSHINSRLLCPALSSLSFQFPVLATNNRVLHEEELETIARVRGRKLKLCRGAWIVDGALEEADF